MIENYILFLILQFFVRVAFAVVAADDDYGDFTDITDGRDFTIDAVEDTVAGRKGIKCSIRVKPKTTPISEDATLVEKLLTYR